MAPELAKGLYFIRFFVEEGKGLYLDTVAPEPGPIGAPGTVKSLPPGTQAAVWYFNKREDGLWTISTGGYDSYETFPMDNTVHALPVTPNFAWQISGFDILPETVYSIIDPSTGASWFMPSDEPYTTVRTEVVNSEEPQTSHLFKITPATEEEKY